jgi:hypothetical protein
MTYLNNNLSPYIKGIRQKQIIGLIDAASLGIFRGNYTKASLPLQHCLKNIPKANASQEFNIVPEELYSSILAKCSPLTLKGNGHHINDKYSSDLPFPKVGEE